MKVCAAIPVYNNKGVLRKTFNRIPKHVFDHIVICDDKSPDGSVDEARSLGVGVIAHEVNKGYGANQKSLFNNAIENNCDIICLIHGDGQYPPEMVDEIIKPINEGVADVVYGSRMMDKGSAKKGGMPLWKRLGNKLLTGIFNYELGINLTDVATGFIAYHRRVIEQTNWRDFDDRWTFDESMIMEVAKKKFRIKEIAIPTYYGEDTSSIGLFDAIKYGLKLTLKVVRES